MRNFFIVFNDINMQENVKGVKVNNFVTIKCERSLANFMRTKYYEFQGIHQNMA